MTIHAILSYENKPQKARNLVVLTPMNKFNPETFLENCFGEIGKDCAKISMWITDIKDGEVITGWFVNRNGKFYFHNGVLI